MKQKYGSDSIRRLSENLNIFSSNSYNLQLKLIENLSAATILCNKFINFKFLYVGTRKNEPISIRDKTEHIKS